jgi:hypothetical protein
MTNPRVPKALNENAAMALGRLGLDNSEQLGPHLSTFAEEWISIMNEVEATEEKATAFKGFSMIVGRNPQAMEKELLNYFTAIARYRDMSLKSPVRQELHDVFQKVSYQLPFVPCTY